MINMVAERGIADRFHFPGFQRGRQVYETYKQSDVFVMPSVSEPFGIAPLEAMQCGTPSIISKQSGCGEILTNVIKTDYWDIHGDGRCHLCTLVLIRLSLITCKKKVKRKWMALHGKKSDCVSVLFMRKY